MLPTLSMPNYEVLNHVQAGLGKKKLHVGVSGLCRFCGGKDPSRFRNRAHTIPEGLGNKWIFSNDECDDCNANFSLYESSLCAAVGAVLTIGGTKGKGGRVRQTGRSRRSHNFRSLDQDGLRRLSVTLLDRANEIEVPLGASLSFGMDGTVTALTPVPIERFVPRLAYKALCKVGLSLVPPEMLSEFSKMLEWINAAEDAENFPFLDVGISVGNLGNAPLIVSGTLLRRVSDKQLGPTIIFILIAGSLCFQIDLMSDRTENEPGIVKFGCVNFPINAVFESNEMEHIFYGNPTHFDWRSSETNPSVVKSLALVHNSNSNESEYTIQWREMLPTG
jgi:hypothetical protein